MCYVDRSAGYIYDDFGDYLDDDDDDDVGDNVNFNYYRLT